MRELSDDVRRALRSVGVPDAGQLADVVRAWPAAVGPAIARVAWPQRISRDGTLHVTTSSATWAFELGRLQAEISGKLAEHVDGDPPTALRFAVGPVPSPGADEPDARRPAPVPTPEEAARGAELAAGIADPDLREAVRRAAAASLAAHRDDRDL